jgi:hypothetical protein
MDITRGAKAIRQRKAASLSKKTSHSTYDGVNWLTAVHRRGWILAAVGVVLILFATNARLLTGEAVPIWDADHAFASWYSLVADFARDGRLLLWNPWTNGGSPDFTDPQFGAFSPIVVVYGLLAGGSLLAFNVYWLLVWVAGGIGMVVLARHLRAPAWGGFVVAVGFLYSGFMTGHAQHTPVLLAFSTLPWVLWRVDAGLRQNRAWPAVEAGMLLGLAALAGYPGMVMAVGGYVVLWAVGRTMIANPFWGARVRSLPRRKELSTLVLSLVLVVLVSAVVASPTYLAFLIEGAGYSDRAGELARDYAVGSNALDPGALATFSSPLLSILQWRTDLWSVTDISSSSIYAGVLASWLALFAIISQRRRPWTWWLVGLAAMGLALAVGPALPFRGWLYDLVPPSRYFRHPAIFRGYFVFTILVLALLATRQLRVMLRRATRAPSGGAQIHLRDERVWQALLICALAVVCAAGAAYWSVAGPRIGAAGIVITMAPWVAVLVAAVAAGRLKGVRGAVPAMLVLVAVLDAVVTSRVAGFTIATEHPQALASWEWVEEHRSKQLSQSSLERSAYLPISNGHTNKHLGVKRAVLSAYTPNENRAHLQWIRNPILGPSALGTDRIWFGTANAPSVPVSDAELDAFMRRTDALGTMPVVVHSRDALLESVTGDSAQVLSATAPAAGRLPYTLLSYDPVELSLRITAPESGYVIVTDRWARGWRAFVDGEEAPLLGADFIFRAVPVQAGSHDIEMRYEPFGFPWLLITSWATTAMIAAISLVIAARRRLAVRTRLPGGR